MKTKLVTVLRGAILVIILIVPLFSYGQKSSTNSDAALYRQIPGGIAHNFREGW